jgi:argininosuccinate lyase
MDIAKESSSKVLLGDHDGRLTKGSDPDLVRYQYVHEVETQKPTFHWVVRYNMAHVLMMHEQNVFSRDDSMKLLTGLRDIEKLGVEGFPLDPEYQGVHPAIEAALVKRYGYEVGGRILTGRARGDVHHTAARLTVRDKLLEVLDEILGLRKVILILAEHHTDTILPAYTWLQAAQPTTLAHDLLHIVEGFEANFAHLKNNFREVNLGTCEAGVGCGTDYPINRERVAQLLGFEGLVENTKFAHRDMGIAEVFLLADLAVLMGHVFRFIDDLYPMTSQEYGYIEFGDEWCTTSFIMPQKKNPTSFKSFRFKALKALSDATMGINTYFSSPSNMLGEMSHIGRIAVGCMDEQVIPALRHLKGMMPTLTIDKELARERAGAYFTQGTNLADAIAREKNLSFRTAHRIVGVLTRDAVKQSVKPEGITVAMVDGAAQEILGHPINLGSQTLRDALDPEVIVKSRKGTGSTGPDMIRRAIENRKKAIAEDTEWLTGKKSVLENAQRDLMQAVDTLVGSA